ncbi:MAG: 1-acyl-sn-glycerol-3-phosphate acyltransferase [Gammaproteobacteria bacterium]|nr:1-acyl-sn-glycerol-3-phosphate acyltransferase [Gammaproteobacteria bacterium]
MLYFHLFPVDTMQNKPFFPIQALLLRIYKWLVIAPILTLTTIVLCSTMTIVSMLGAPDFASRVFATLWARINLLAMLCKVDVLRSGHVIPGQPYVVVANHQSLIDIYVIYGKLNMDIKWVMKKELEKVPFLGTACKKMGHILIDRGDSLGAQQSIEDARARIMRGNSVVFFPEGTRSRDGQLLQFKKGAFRLALELGLPVLPVTIDGTGKVLPSDTMHWQPGHLRLIVHDPISTDGMTAKDVNHLRDATKAAINSGLQCHQPTGPNTLTL